MSTEPKQLTPTERVKNLISNQVTPFTVGTSISLNYAALRDFALELATELERVQMEFANAQLHWNQERDELKRQVGELEQQRSEWKSDNAKLRAEITILKQTLQVASVCSDVLNAYEKIANLTKELDAEKILRTLYYDERNRLQDENTELRKDKERLNWLTSAVGDTRQATEQVIELYQDDATHDFFVKEISNEKISHTHFGRTLRQALDEAMKGK